MQIVIDIPEQMYLNAKADTLCGADILVSAIKNATPLPKGHGRLIDENKLKKEAIRCEWSRSAYDMLDHTLSYMKPIIDADKESD